MLFSRLSVLAVAMAAGIGGASAATVQNSRGTFIQDRHGAWHQYVRVSERRSLADVYASARYGDRGQYYRMPQIRSSIGFNGRNEYDYGTSAQYLMVPERQYSSQFYGNEGYSYPVAYVSGGPAYPYAGILSER